MAQVVHPGLYDAILIESRFAQPMNGHPADSVVLDAPPARRVALSPAGSWLLVAALWVAYVLNYCDRQSVFSIFPVLRREFGFTDVQLGLIGSIFVLVYSTCGVLAGGIADRVRRDRLVILSVALWSLAMLGTTTSFSVGSFLGWRAVMAVTESLYVPAALGLIAVWHPGSTRTRAIAIHCTAPPVGLVLGGWFGGWSAETIGWRWGFALPGALGLLYCGVLFLILRRSAARGASQPRRQSNLHMWEIMRSRCYVAEAFAYFFFQLVLWMIYSWLPYFIYRRYHLSMAASGVTATIYLQPSTVIGVMAGGALGDYLTRSLRYSRFLIGGAGLLISCPFAWLMLATGSLPVLRISAIAFGLSVGLLISNSWPAAFDVVDEGNYSFAAAFLNMSSGMAAGVGIFLAGLWSDTFTVLIAWSAGITSVTALGMMIAPLLFFDRDRKAILARRRLRENLT
jgi:MFS family permease